MAAEPQTLRRKLIEVALPLEVINREAERDTPKRSNHPWRMHFWWARRKLATARAVLFAQLVDDPSSRPDLFPTIDDQRLERERLHRLIESLVDWDNARDERILAAARKEIEASTGSNLPTILDPFAGGGSIPLEAQRLGLDTYASDLNPVAVLINKALIEIPRRFNGHPPVFPGLADAQMGEWQRARGLAADVRAYGDWIQQRALERVGYAYPKAEGRLVTAWVWARTVHCPNPGCQIPMPLVKSWLLAKKRTRKVFIVPSVARGEDEKLRVCYRVSDEARELPEDADEGTVGRRGAKCISCGTAVPLSYIREEGRAKRLGQQLMALIVAGDRRREYVSPTSEHEMAATITPPDDTISGSIGHYPRDLKAPTYGLTEFRDLFTGRQLLIATTLSDLVTEAHARVIADGGSREYADAVATYLALALSRGTDYQSNLTTWQNQNEQIRNVFARQAIPMAWDFIEVNALGTGAGTWNSQVELGAQALEGLICDSEAQVHQQPAQAASKQDMVLSTDPPYYDNVEYAELANFFYVWLRRTLRNVHPDLFSTLLSPKDDELVANEYRQAGKAGAKQFFEQGFRQIFQNARQVASNKFPITVYYAFKQSESDPEGRTSSGWETLLEGMIQSGWTITSTWPFRTETASRMLAQGKNVLSSSIVLSLRPRVDDAPVTDRRGFISAIEGELPGALRKLQQGQIAPVDLPQAAIGPGMAVFSRYSAVLEPDGARMSVRSALARINEILDQVLNEQEGDFDATSRFAIAWYRQHGYGTGKFGDADNLARAQNTSVETMDREGILTSRAGKVQLTAPDSLSWDYDPVTDLQCSNWEGLHHLIKTLERDGIAPAGDFFQAALSRPDGAVDADLVKELAHLLFRIAESNGWTKDALSFNNLVTSWPEILDVAHADRGQPLSTQATFDYAEDED